MIWYDAQAQIKESWLIRPSGDTVRHSLFAHVDYFSIESKYGLYDSLRSQLRYTDDGILNWELFFNHENMLDRELYRKKDGSIFKEVTYEHKERIIKSSTYAPVFSYQIGSADDQRGELTSQVLTRLNASGKTVQIISKNSSGQTDWERRNAYRSGRLVKSAQLGPDGKPIIIFNYTHNELGLVLTETAIDKHDSTLHVIENRYDDEHRLIWQSFRSSLNGASNSNRFYYDEYSRVNREEIIENQQFNEVVVYDYYPEYYMRLAIHSTPEGELLRKEVENYFENNVFSPTQVNADQKESLHDEK